MFGLPPPRHISTLPKRAVKTCPLSRRLSPKAATAAASAQRLAATLLNLPMLTMLLENQPVPPCVGAAQNLDTDKIDGAEEKSRGQTASLEQRS